MQLIFESEKKNIFYKERNRDGSPSVVLKVLKNEHPSPSELSYLYNEFEITKGLDISGIRKVYEKTKIDDKEALVLEYIKGQTLKDTFVKQRRSIKDFLEVAVSIAHTLEEIHRHSIIHKDINSNNILVDAETNVVKIIDFSISSKISIKIPHLGNPDKLEGTLAYVSPEQTGRVNRVVDYRTDLYSLGVTFYEILVGELPFSAEDLTALIHCHIAQTPTPPTDLDSSIPRVLSNIVMKLMNKNAEDRYQSAFGLKGDLENCLQQLKRTGNIESFEIATDDFSTQFQIPQKLYGREKEINILMQSFFRVSQGSTEMLLVSGYSGIGKSALINEVQKPIMEKRGYFMSGKFDQLQKTIPYYAIAQAFQQFINLLLTEDEHRLTAWKETIQKAVGTVGKVLTDVMPNLELIIGKQPEVSELGGTEAQSRFNYVFKAFLKSIARADHPVVLFIDDLQWADTASLDLLKIIQTDPDILYFLLLGAYRDNEVSPSHPAMLTVKEIQEEDGIVQEISLPNLSLEDINQLTADALYSGLYTALPLAKLIYVKTHGNPFFVNQFLRTLYEEKLLVFDFQKHRWKWDIEEVKSLNVTDNVVDLMAKKIQKLPGQTQEALKLAACIGNRFDLSNLAIINEKSQKATAKQLWVALEEGLIMPIGTDYKLIDAVMNGHTIKVQYQFIHDRVQEAAYQLINETDKKSVHLSIGELLLSNVVEEDGDELLFDIVNHLNKGIELVSSADKKEELSQLNLEAGEKARLSAAFEPALSYFQTGISLIEDSTWENCYDLKLSLYSKAAEVSHLTGNYEQTEEKAEVVLQNALTVLDKTKAYEAKVLSCISQGKMSEAVTTAIVALKSLGITFPKKPNIFHILISVLKTKLILMLKGYKNLINLPVMTDPHAIASMQIISRIGSASYMAVPELMPLTILKMIRLSIRYGNHDLTAFSYAGYGFILSGMLQQMNSGYKYGQLSLAMLEKLAATNVKTKVLFMNHFFINHWKIHIRKAIAPLHQAYRSGLETGDIEFGVYALSMGSMYAFYSNAKLPDLIKEITSNSKVILQLKQTAAVHRVDLFRQTVLNLIGESNHTYKLIGEAYNEDHMLSSHIQCKDNTTTFMAYYHKLYLCYHFEQYTEALENSEQAKKYQDSAVGTALIPLRHFYDSLSRLALYPTVNKSRQKSLLRQVTANQKKMKKWSYHAPMNYLHKYHLIKAEMYRILGKNEKARTHYDNSISLAKKNDCLSDEALAYELAGKLFRGSQQDHLATFYMQKTLKLYDLWGAKAKVEYLAHKYAIKTNYSLQTSSHSTQDVTLSSTTTSKLVVKDSLDLNSIIKATNTMSGEVKLNSLLDKMIGIIIENAGAEKCSLLLQRSGIWFIRAAADITTEEGTRLKPMAIDETSMRVPNSIVNYVIRTKKNLILNNASEEEKFANDQYIKQHHPKSVLCMPVFNQGALYGLLYLENNLTEGAFTQQHLEVLYMLSTQMAISLENANLYENLEESVKERTIWITRQKEIIEEKNKDITDSIRYAQRIQHAILTSDEYLQKMLPEHFILYKPKDIVSGDFYWGYETPGGKAIWVAADCTGHGVPGAFMSMIAHSLLNEVIIEKGVEEADQILNELRAGIIKAFGQTSGSFQQTDGLDAALCILHKKKNTLEFAGAFNPLYVVRKGISKAFSTEDPRFRFYGNDLLEIKGDKQSIAFDYNGGGPFLKHELQLQRGDMLYSFSDGFQDQFGGEKGKKFSAKRLKELVLSIRQKPVAEQKETLTQTIESWRSDINQVDDILMIGVRIPE
ncbi:MAG: serine/threonine-protein kinase PknK [Flavobacteriales bacterium]|nr:MAG: serine/threonine-protein kinase PknK [Flavobacteriales bacterium]